MSIFISAFLCKMPYEKEMTHFAWIVEVETDKKRFEATQFVVKNLLNST
ncbi:hypothetical protein [Flavobacterium sp.]|nr:hypothetical protein [Flavobacterium sp.]